MGIEENIERKELITTGLFLDNISQNNSIYLGNWCFSNNTHSGIDIKKATILEYPISSNDLLFIESEINQVFEILLREISICYNEYFNLNKPVQYYNIILGRWLYHFLNNIYEKKILIEKAVKSYPNLYTKIPEHRIIELIDSEDYNQKSYHSHEFNYYLTSYIIQDLDLPELKLIKQNYTFVSNSINSFSAGIIFKNIIISIYQFSLLKINKLFCKKLILVVSPYYPKNTFFNSLWFFFKSLGKIVHYKFEHTQSMVYTINFQLIELFYKKLKLK